MRRGLAVATSMSLVLTMLLLWAADAAARNGGGGFRSGSRATRGEDTPPRSGLERSAPESSDSAAPAPRKAPTLRTWRGEIRGLLLGGLIGSVPPGRGFGIGLIEIAILSGLIVLAFRALSGARAAPARRWPAATAARGRPGARAAAAATIEDGREALARGLTEIQRADPAFDPAGFARTVEDAFGKVQAAWTARDVGRAADVLSVEMREQLEKECERLRAARRINRVESITLRRAAIAEIRQEHGWDRVAVHIVAHLIDYTTDEGGLKVLAGNPFAPVQLQERWEFLRPSGSHAWRVSAIR
jgi:predicted lipid-binding transport protein (Tim44 family)